MLQAFDLVKQLPAIGLELFSREVRLQIFLVPEPVRFAERNFRKLAIRQHVEHAVRAHDQVRERVGHEKKSGFETTKSVNTRALLCSRAVETLQEWR